MEQPPPNAVTRADDAGDAGVPLKEWQTAAIDAVVSKMREHRGALLYGGVGSGKTIMVYHSLKRVATERQRNTTVLAVMPSCVLGQWVGEEREKAGLPQENVLAYAKTKAARTKQLNAFLKRAACETEVYDSDPETEAAQPPSIFVCCATYEMVLSDIKNAKRRSPLARRWDVLVFDEAHRLRNGIDKHAERGDATAAAPPVRYGLKVYAVLEEYVVKAFDPSCLFVTATPVVNHQIDVLSLLRWTPIRSDLLTVSSWKDRDASYDAAKEHFADNYLVAVKQPPVPSITRIQEKIQRRPDETAWMRIVYAELRERARKLIEASRRAAENPTEYARERRRTAARVFQSQLTKARRGELNPFFVRDVAEDHEGGSEETDDQGEEEDVEGAVEKEEHDEQDEEDERDKRDDQGKGVEEEEGDATLACVQACRKKIAAKESFEVTARRPEVLELAKGGAKFAHAIELARRLPGMIGEEDGRCGKLLLLASYVQPLQLLAQMMRSTFEREALPVLVVEYYGSMSRSAKEGSMQLFKESTQAAVLVASRASLGVGTNIPWTRQILKLDADWSPALEEQADGRIRRPLVQETHEWFSATTDFDDKLIERDDPPPSPFSVEAWMRRVQTGKGKTAADILSTKQRDGGMEKGLDASDGSSGEAKGEASAVVGSVSLLVEMIDAAIMPAPPVKRQKRPLSVEKDKSKTRKPPFTRS